MTRTEKRINFKDFTFIDELLSSIRYKNISLTGVPGNFLKGTFITNPYRPTFKTLLLNIMSRTRLRYFQNFHSELNPKVLDEVSAPYIFSFTDQSARLMDFAVPVINKLGQSKCLATSPVKQAAVIIDTNRYHAFPSITKSVYVRWKKEYATISPQVKKCIRQIRLKLKISLAASIELELQAMYLTLLYENAFDFLNRTKPKAIICDSDRQATNCALVMVAKQLGIPSFTFIHGAIDPPDNYIPILADYIFCWGNDHVQMLTSVKTPTEKMIVTGNTKLSRNIPVQAASVRQKLKLQPDDKRKIIVLFTNNIETVLQQKLAQSFISSCSGNKDVLGIVKLHPLESPEDYSGLTFSENVKLYKSSELSLDETLALADGVMTHNSLVAVDTLIKRKPLAILNTIDLALGIAERLHTEADVPMISDQLGFDRFVQSLSDNTYNFELKEKFVHNYCSAFGREAVDNTIHAILSKA